MNRTVQEIVDFILGLIIIAALPVMTVIIMLNGPVIHDGSQATALTVALLALPVIIMFLIGIIVWQDRKDRRQWKHIDRIAYCQGCRKYYREHPTHPHRDSCSAGAQNLATGQQACNL